MQGYSIVIPCKNEEVLIGKLLRSIERQTAISYLDQTVVADADSSDDSLNIIEQYRKTLNTKIVKGGLPAKGRNEGAKEVKSKYILFVDADVELGEESTIEKLLSLAEKKNLDCVTAYVKCPDGSYKDTFFWKSHGIVSDLFTPIWPFSAGMIILIKRDKFFELGGFNEQITLGEDVELTRKIDKRKFALARTFINTTNRRFKSMGYVRTSLTYLMVFVSKRFRHRPNTFYFKN